MADEFSLEEALAAGETDILEINSDLRTINVPSGYIFGVFNDKDVLPVLFKMNKTYDALDMSTFQIRINFQNAVGTTASYIVTDKKVDGNKIYFSWLLGREVFVGEGSVKFVVCLRKFNTDGTVDKEFNTTIARSTVLNGLEADDPESDPYRIIGQIDSIEILLQCQEIQADIDTKAESAEELYEKIKLAEINYGAPFTAATASEMTNRSRVYVYTGSESGYNNGHWYYHNGTAWTDGGTYQSTGVNTDKTLTVPDMAADAKTVGDKLTAETTARETAVAELKNDLEFTNNNLPWYQTYSTSIFSHGQVQYGSGAWSDTVARWGTKDLQYADEDIYLSISEYEPELNYHICLFTQDGTYKSWSGWQKKDSGEYKISAGSYYKITIARVINSSDEATTDYIYQLVKNTGLKQTVEDVSVVTANKFKWINNGIRFNPILVGGYTGDSVIRDSSTLDYRRRYKTMLKPKFIYAGSYIYCDTANMYRMRVVKRETPENENGVVISNNIVIPTQESPYVFSEDGYYTIHFMAYTGGTEVVLNSLYSHITFGLYSDATNSVFVDFIGSGRTFQGPADATLFIGEHGKTLLIDGAYQNMQGNLINEIHNMGIDHLDYVMVSHYHNDHFAGLTILYEDNDLSPDNTTFILPSEEGVAYALEHLSADMSVDWYNRFMAVLNNADCVITHPKNDDAIDIGGMTVRFWNADHSIYEGVSTNYNDWSLCCYVTYGTQRICMTGDLGPIGERLNQGKMLKSNIYKAHHHGWDGTSVETDVMGMKRYMSEIMPDIIVALDGGAHDSLYLQDTSPLIPWCEANAVPLYRAHEWSPIKVEVTKDSFKMITTARRYIRDERETS